MHPRSFNRRVTAFFRRFFVRRRKNSQHHTRSCAHVRRLFQVDELFYEAVGGESSELVAVEDRAKHLGETRGVLRVEHRVVLAGDLGDVDDPLM